MTIKEAFEKAENGTLTYEQFQELTKESKFADLSTGDYVSKSKFDNELATRDKQIETLNSTLTTRDSDLEAIKKQLQEAGVDKEALEKLTTDMGALQARYDSDTKSYQEKLNHQKYEFAVKEFAAGKKFSSNAAKRDFVQTMIAKNLQMDNDIILGAEDFANAYSANNADAFVTETPNPKDDSNKPRFVDPTSPNSSNTGKDETGGFHWDFMGVR